MEIEEICRRARAEGLSYGQYVWKHKVELAGKRPEPIVQENLRYCQYCGRGFIPTNANQKYCRPYCRVAWSQTKTQREKGV